MEAELVSGPREALASHVIAELGIGRRASGGEPAFDLFDDLRDTAVVDLEVSSDLPLQVTPDFDAFIDFELALGGRAKPGFGLLAWRRWGRGRGGLDGIERAIVGHDKYLRSLSY
jgi:hypothetical protein